MNKSSIDRTCLVQSRKAFRANYPNPLFIIRGPFVGNNSADVIEEQEESIIIIRNFVMILKILNNFGDIVKRWQVSFDEIDVSQCNEIIDSIDGQCIVLLEELNLENCKGKCQLNSLFKQVLTFKFSSSPQIEMSIENFKWKNVFPNVQNLYLAHITASDWTYIDGKWSSNLVALIFQLSDSKEQNDEETSNIINFLKGNREIESLEIENCNLNFMNEAKNYLPHLEYRRIIT